ncbi:MAG TPA: GDSL-type esterase/lipase family protein, partial [Planctomycetota bacterium]|nr:GDSL-type esterase/lipase family protein [Planctomycetota bacterium]
CQGKYGGAALPVKVEGSRGLKLAFLAKGEHFPAAALNVADALSKDNTTSYAYRVLPDGAWRPVLYRLDAFRYNSRGNGTVSTATAYTRVNFFLPADIAAGATPTLTLDDLVLYRGDDRTPPEKPAALEAKPGPDGVRLSWEPALDNVAPMLYVVSRAGPGGAFAKIAETVAPRLLDGAAGKGKVRYRVAAVDFEENLGPWSDAVEVESAAEARPAPPATEEEVDRLAYAASVRRIHDAGLGQVKRSSVLLFGDSLTVATVYRQSVEAALGTCDVAAWGAEGQRTSWGRAAIPKAKEVPEYLCILFGTNDVHGVTLAAKPLDAAIENLEAIVGWAHDHGTVAVLGTIPPRGFDDPDSAPEKAYDEAVVAAARRLKVPVAYIFRDLQAAGDRRRLISKDGVHWTADGMRVAAGAWEKAIDQVRWVLRDRP